MQGFDEILLPGEPDARAFEKRSRDGMPIDEGTWARIAAVAAAREVNVRGIA